MSSSMGLERHVAHVPLLKEIIVWRGSDAQNKNYNMLCYILRKSAVESFRANCREGSKEGATNSSLGEMGMLPKLGLEGWLGVF